MPYVLVHGGGFAGSCWDELLPLLDGESIAVDLPGRGRTPGDLATLTVADFVASVADEIVARDLTDVTLVGHSMAGLTLPGVAERVPDRLRRLVFVSCSVPAHGETVLQILGGFSPAGHEMAERVGDDAIESGGGLPPDIARVIFCNDMDETQTISTLERIVPEAMGVMTEPADLTGLGHPIPRTFVRLTGDAIVSPETQDRMIKNLGNADVVNLDAGHMAMISRPQALADVLNAL
jgi:pimeloyl-ACP methyl ester carboxylesterase